MIVRNLESHALLLSYRSLQKISPMLIKVARSSGYACNARNNPAWVPPASKDPKRSDNQAAWVPPSEKVNPNMGCYLLAGRELSQRPGLHSPDPGPLPQEVLRRAVTFIDMPI